TASYPAPTATRDDIRARLPEVQHAVANRSADLVDVRSPAEFAGDIVAPPGLGESALRGGHIPGACNLPWNRLCREDGRFRDPDDIAALLAERGVDGSRPIIVYCRIGERSSHTWFALTHL